MVQVPKQKIKVTRSCVLCIKRKEYVGAPSKKRKQIRKRVAEKKHEETNCKKSDMKY
jgi:hypothetical protein